VGRKAMLRRFIWISKLHAISLIVFKGRMVGLPLTSSKLKGTWRGVVCQANHKFEREKING